MATETEPCEQSGSPGWGPYLPLIATAAGTGVLFVVLLLVFLLGKALGWAAAGTELVVVTMTVCGCSAALATIATMACRLINGHTDRQVGAALGEVRTLVALLVQQAAPGERVNGSAPAGLDAEVIALARKIGDRIHGG